MFWKKTKNKNNWGFTLIEMLIVIAIIGIIIAMVGFSQKNSIQRKKAETVARIFKQYIELTRDYALTGEVTTGEILPSHYALYYDAGGKKLEIKGYDGSAWRSMHDTTDSVFDFGANNIDTTDLTFEYGTSKINEGFTNSQIVFSAPHAVMENTANISSSCQPLSPGCTIKICGDTTCTSSLTYELTISETQITLK